MRQAHLLLILLILVAVGSHAYVALNWDYRDAPSSVKYALGLGFLVTALLAILLGPKMFRGRGRGAIVLPVLVLLLVSLSGVTSSAGDVACGSRMFTYDPASRYLTGAGVQIVSRDHIIPYLFLNPFYPGIGPDPPRVDGYIEWWLRAGNQTYYTVTGTKVISIPGHILAAWHSPGEQLYVKACVRWAPTTTGDIALENTTSTREEPETSGYNAEVLGLGILALLGFSLLALRHGLRHGV